jgi:hypothetical protein
MRKNMKVLHCSLIICFLLVGASNGAAQNRTAPANAQFPQTILGTCEENISYLSNAHHLAGTDGTIIAIARLGGGERNRELTRRRLHNVRIFLTEFGWHRAPETVFIAEGERVSGHGRVELYIRGVLFAVLEVRRNQDLLVGSCEPADERPIQAERNLYPYKDLRPRQR